MSENQVDTLKDAIRLNKAVTLCFPKGGDHVLLPTPAQITARPVVKNVNYTGGFFGMLASPASRALPGVRMGSFCTPPPLSHKHGR